MNIELAPISEKYMLYDEAVLYCHFLKHDGHNDWRMPIFSEWNTHIKPYVTPHTPYLWHTTMDRALFKWLRVIPVRDV